MKRKKHVDRFYELSHDLEGKVNDKRKLKDCSGRMKWPDRGVYFFFAKDEWREGGSSLRITRIGTHALKDGSGRDLWSRLREHRGTFSGNFKDGGDHRASVFRKIVGESMIKRNGLENEFPHWGEGYSASRDIKEGEHEMELRVSSYIRELPFLWLKVNDEPSPDSDRGYIERNSIALISNYRKDPIDPRDEGWLGYHSPKEKIKRSGLWNSDHVTERYDPNFLDVMEEYIEKM